MKTSRTITFDVYEDGLPISLENVHKAIHAFRYNYPGSPEELVLSPSARKELLRELWGGTHNLFGLVLKTENNLPDGHWLVRTQSRLVEEIRT